MVNGKIEKALPKLTPPPLPITIMYPHRRQLAPRVRVFIDWVVERLAEIAGTPRPTSN